MAREYGVIVVVVQIDRPPRLQWLLASPCSLAPDSHTDTSRPFLIIARGGEKKSFHDATLEGKTERQREGRGKECGRMKMKEKKKEKCQDNADDTLLVCYDRRNRERDRKGVWLCLYMRKRSSELTDNSAADLKQSRVNHRCTFKDRGRPMNTAFKTISIWINIMA